MTATRAGFEVFISLTIIHAGRIGLSLVAIHTTSDLLQEVMIRIAQRPELFQVLRNEIVEVLGRDGLKKTALYNLKTMDSVLKESQRLKTNSLRKPALSLHGSGMHLLTQILDHSWHDASRDKGLDTVQRSEDSKRRAGMGRHHAYAIRGDLGKLRRV